MKILARNIDAILDTYLGRCPKCVRTSFLVAVAASCAALILPTATNSPFLTTASRVLAVASAGLWLSHLVAFALRAGRSASMSNETALRETRRSSPYQGARRQFIVSFAKSFVFAVAATALPFRSAFAADCNCASPLKCCWDFTGTVSVCAAADAVCCAGQNPWSCPNGHNCYGDGGCS
jgi:hypothetical protein